MPNAFDQRAAAAIIGMQGKGENVPNDVLDAAARIQIGMGSESNVKLVHKFLGNKRGGGSALRKLRGKLKGAIQGAANISRDVELYDQASREGRSTSVAQARLVNTLTTELDKFTRSKLVRNVVSGVAQRLGADAGFAARMLKNIGRFARLGGAVATIAQIGVDLAESHLSQRKKIAEFQGSQKDLTRLLELDPRLGRRIEGAGRAIGYEQASAWQKLKAALGFGESLETDVNDVTTRLKKLRAVRRDQFARQGGGKVLAALARKAAETGGSISDLSSWQAKQAIDEALGNFGPDTFRNDAVVNAQLDREFGGWDNVPAAGMRNYLSLYTFGLVKSESQMMELRRTELAVERMEQVIKYREARDKDRINAAAQMRAFRTPAQKLEHLVDQQRNLAQWNQYRSRHKAWSND